jgi:hypothetical protein
MPPFPKTASALALVFALGSAPLLAAPLPVPSFPSQCAYELVAAERKASAKVESTKAWLKAKKTQTGRWMGRQKQKLKQLVD